MSQYQKTLCKKFESFVTSSHVNVQMIQLLNLFFKANEQL